jgi:hypothetical protein
MNDDVAHSTIGAQRIALGDLDDVAGTSARVEASKWCETSHSLNSSESSFMSFRAYVPISVMWPSREDLHVSKPLRGES